MLRSPVIFIFILLASLFTAELKAFSPEDMQDRHILIAMRSIGHEILLNAGDSTSVVLPIERIKDQYQIRFDTEFEFLPLDVVNTISKVLKENNVADSYQVEIVRCDSNKVIYAYEVDKADTTASIPCLGRTQEKACYMILIAFIPSTRDMDYMYVDMASPNKNTKAKKDVIGSKTYFLLLLLFIVFSLLGVYFWRKRRQPADSDANILKIGAYRFDKRNMELSFKNKIIELSSKEADLLFLLHSSANTTIERDVILRIVWGDEGDYVGRTLDVFISKLRKKLEEDAAVRIVNIRGIGYKLILND